MTRRKTLTSIDRQIELTKSQMLKVKARYDKLAEKLLELNREKRLRQSEILLDAVAKSGKSLDEVLTFLGG